MGSVGFFSMSAIFSLCKCQPSRARWQYQKELLFLLFLNHEIQHTFPYHSLKFQSTCNSKFSDKPSQLLWGYACTSEVTTSSYTVTLLVSLYRAAILLLLLLYNKFQSLILWLFQLIILSINNFTYQSIWDGVLHTWLSKLHILCYF